MAAETDAGYPNRELIERVAALLERLPSRSLRPGELTEPTVYCRAVEGAEDYEADGHSPGGDDPGHYAEYTVPPAPMKAFALDDGFVFNPASGHTTGGVVAATLIVSEQYGDGDPAVAHHQEMHAAGGEAGPAHVLSDALHIDLETASALAEGNGLTIPARAVTGAMAANALRAVLDGRNGEEVWRDVNRETAPWHLEGPRIHPTAFVDPQADLGPDAVVGAGAYIGGHVVVLSGTRVEDGCRIDDRAVLGPNTVLEEDVWVGSDARVQNAQVAAGSVIEDTAVIDGVELPTARFVAAGEAVGRGGIRADETVSIELPARHGARTREETRIHETAQVHPSAVVLPGARIERDAIVAAGTVIGRDARVNEFARVGEDAVVGTGAVIRKGARLEGGHRERTIVGVDASVGEIAAVRPGAIVRAGGRVADGAIVNMGEASSVSRQRRGSQRELPRHGPIAPLRTSQWERWQQYQSAGGPSSDVPADIARRPDHLVHPTATVHPSVELNPNTIVGPGAVIGEGVVLEGACEVRAGAHVQANSHISSSMIGHGATVGHGSTIADSTIAGAVGGADPVQLGRRANIQDSSIGAGVVAGQDLDAVSVSLSSRVVIGEHVRLAADVTIKTGAHIGDETCLNEGVRVERGAELGKHVVAGAGGTIRENARVGEGTTIGHASSIGTKARVGEWTELGHHVEVPAGARVEPNTYVEEFDPYGPLPKGVHRDVAIGAHAPAPATGQVAAGAAAANDRPRSPATEHSRSS